MLIRRSEAATPPPSARSRTPRRDRIIITAPMNAKRRTGERKKRPRKRENVIAKSTLSFGMPSKAPEEKQRARDVRKEKGRIGEEIRSECQYERDGKRTDRRNTDSPAVEKENRNEQRAARGAYGDAAGVEIEIHRVERIDVDAQRTLDRIQNGVRNHAEQRQAGSLVRVDVLRMKRDVVGVDPVAGGECVDRKRVLFDDRAREVEGRVLVPASPAEEPRVGDEDQHEQPACDAAVSGRDFVAHSLFATSERSAARSSSRAARRSRDERRRRA